MLQSSEKLNHFTSTVLKDASAESEAILRKLEETRRAALSDAEEKAVADAVAFIKSESARARSEAGKQISLHMLENQKALALRREEIAQSVFAQVRAEIEAYTATPAYRKRLQALFVEVLGKLTDSSGLVLYLRPQDMDAADSLRPLAEHTYVEVVEGDFTLGGLVVVCPDQHLRFDATFDSAIQELDGHFAELFGLSLTGSEQPSDGQ